MNFYVSFDQKSCIEIVIFAEITVYVPINIVEIGLTDPPHEMIVWIQLPVKGLIWS